MKVFTVLLVSLACFSSVIVGAASLVVVRVESQTPRRVAFCGGFRLTNINGIITASQCVFGTVTTEVKIGFNTTFRRTFPPPVATVVIKHPLVDVSLLLLGLDFPSLNTSSPAISQDVVEEGDVGTVISEHPESQYIDNVNVTVMGNDYCREKIPYLPSWKFCTDKCFDTPGESLLIGDRIAGIVSWREEECQPGSPGVFTRVSGLSSWINSFVF